MRSSDRLPGGASSDHGSRATTTTTMNSSSSVANDNGGGGGGGGYGRVLLYVTSHFSPQHEMFLRYCWGNVLARSSLLRSADVAVYLNANDDERRGAAMDVLKETFRGNDLTVHLRDPLDGGPKKTKRMGALKAVRGEKRAFSFFPIGRALFGRV